jgi:hypothetical protein
MDLNEITTLKKFLGDAILQKGCGLYLPKFSGPVELKSDQNSPVPLVYPGNTFSDRDAKSALHVSSLLGHVLDPDKIQLKDATSFSTNGTPQTFFLFGSRSNQATMWVIDQLATRKLFRFNFGAEWQIICEDKKVFSIHDPSQLGRGEYEDKTDWGVVGRLSGQQGTAFVIAGLGGRATEGCGLYFSLNWQELYNRYKKKDFAVVLKFPPPIDPNNFETVAWYGNGISQP